MKKLIIVIILIALSLIACVNEPQNTEKESKAQPSALAILQSIANNFDDIEMSSNEFIINFDFEIDDILLNQNAKLSLLEKYFNHATLLIVNNNDYDYKQGDYQYKLYKKKSTYEIQLIQKTNGETIIKIPLNDKYLVAKNEKPPEKYLKAEQLIFKSLLDIVNQNNIISTTKQIEKNFNNITLIKLTLDNDTVYQLIDNYIDNIAKEEQFKNNIKLIMESTNEKTLNDKQYEKIITNLKNNIQKQKKYCTFKQFELELKITNDLLIEANNNIKLTIDNKNQNFSPYTINIELIFKNLAINKPYQMPIILLNEENSESLATFLERFIFE